ncbi:MAG: glcE [Gammaproteobacteria bacterium]|nr:glcE [Gammaproteobacteria bacterium]
MTDNGQILQQQVQAAYADRQPLCVQGSGSKNFYGHPVTATLLDTSTHTGIVSYEPTELVLTARAGTRLTEIEAALTEHGQMLGCEAPHFGPNATFGGMIAAGLSGPRRPFAGSVSDLILGCRILNGKGEILKFGGKVMKNVAGYDISRLLAGSLGCLAVILEATVKLLPRHTAERTFRFGIAPDKAMAFVNKLTAMGYPVSATSHDRQHLVVRFSAGAGEIGSLADRLRQQFDFIEHAEETNDDYWLAVREQQIEFFTDAHTLWRLSLAPAVKHNLPGVEFVEWNGALRWLKTDAAPAKVFDRLAHINGAATLFRSEPAANADARFQPLAPALQHWHRQLKLAFDPAGILNPGRMYQDL